jgi:hypothetical protein
MRIQAAIAVFSFSEAKRLSIETFDNPAKVLCRAGILIHQGA